MVLPIRTPPARLAIPFTAAIVPGGAWGGAGSTPGLALPPGGELLPGPPVEALPAGGIARDWRIGVRGGWVRAVGAADNEAVLATTLPGDVGGATWPEMFGDDDLCLILNVRVPSEVVAPTEFRECFVGLAQQDAQVFLSSPPSFSNMVGWYHTQPTQFARAAQRIVLPLSRPNVGPPGGNVIPRYAVVAMLHTGPSPSPVAFVSPLFLSRYSVEPISSSVSFWSPAVPAAPDSMPLVSLGPGSPVGVAGAHFTREVEVFVPPSSPDGVRVSCGTPVAATGYVTIPPGGRLRVPTYRADFVYIQSDGAALPPIPWISYT